MACSNFDMNWPPRSTDFDNTAYFNNFDVNWPQRSAAELVDTTMGYANNFATNWPQRAIEQHENNTNFINSLQGAINRTTTTADYQANKQNFDINTVQLDQLLVGDTVSSQITAGPSYTNWVQICNPTATPTTPLELNPCTDLVPQVNCGNLDDDLAVFYNINKFFSDPTATLDQLIRNLHALQMVGGGVGTGPSGTGQLASLMNQFNQGRITFLQVLTEFVANQEMQISCICRSKICVCHLLFSCLRDKILTPMTISRYNIFFSPLWECEVLYLPSLPMFLRRKPSPHSLCAYSFFNNSTICDVRQLSCCERCLTTYCSNCLRSNYHALLCVKQEDLYNTALMKGRFSLLKQNLNRLVRFYQMLLILTAALMDVNNSFDTIDLSLLTFARSIIDKRQRELEQKVKETYRLKSDKLERLACIFKKKRLQLDAIVANIEQNSSEDIMRKFTKIANDVKRLQTILVSVKKINCTVEMPMRNTHLIKMCEQSALIIIKEESFQQVKLKLAERLASMKNLTVHDFLLPKNKFLASGPPPSLPQQQQPQQQQRQRYQKYKTPTSSTTTTTTAGNEVALPRNNRFVKHNNGNYHNYQRNNRKKTPIVGRNRQNTPQLLEIGESDQILTLLPRPPSFYQPHYFMRETFTRARPIPGLVHDVIVADNSKYYPLVISPPKETPGELTRPWGICINHLNQILLTDRIQHCVKIYDSNGSFLMKFGEFGTNIGQFHRPAGLTISLRGDIIVADKDNHRIQVFNCNYEFVSTFGKKGPYNGDLNYPWAVACSKNGFIAVSDSKNERVQIFDNLGNFLANITHFDNMKLDHPRGICFAPNDDLLVSDFNLHRIVRFHAGNIHSTIDIGGEGTERKKFQRPQGIICDDVGNVIVVDTNNHRIQVFDQWLRFKFMISNGMGAMVGKMNKPADVALSPDGKIAIVDNGNNRVQVF